MGWGGVAFLSTRAAKSARKHALNISCTFTPNRRLCCLFQAGLGPHLGRHHHAYGWERIFSAFTNPAACGSSLVPSQNSEAMPRDHLTFRCFVSPTLRHLQETFLLGWQICAGKHAPTLRPQSALFCAPKVSVLHGGKQQHVDNKRHQATQAPSKTDENPKHVVSTACRPGCLNSPFQDLSEYTPYTSPAGHSARTNEAAMAPTP